MVQIGLDRWTTRQTGASHTALEAMGQFNRAKDESGKQEAANNGRWAYLKRMPVKDLLKIIKRM
jgi:hypothetical protein